MEVYHKASEGATIVAQIQLSLMTLEHGNTVTINEVHRALPSLYFCKPFPLCIFVTLWQVLKPGPDRRSVSGSLSLRSRAPIACA